MHRKNEIVVPYNIDREKMNVDFADIFKGESVGVWGLQRENEENN